MGKQYAGQITTQTNKKNICDAVQNEFLSGFEIAKLVEVSYSRVTVLLGQLVDSGHVIAKDMRVEGQTGSARRYYKGTGKIYVIDLSAIPVDGKYYKPMNYFGEGEFFNPFSPKIPNGKVRDIRLLDKKRDSAPKVKRHIQVNHQSTLNSIYL